MAILVVLSDPIFTRVQLSADQVNGFFNATPMPTLGMRPFALDEFAAR
jgi:hypothetical protein